MRLSRICAVLFCLVLILSCSSVIALRVIASKESFENWTHVGEFVFHPQGKLSGHISTVHLNTYLAVFEEATWLDLRASFEPKLSTCQLKSLAMWSTPIWQSGDTSVSFVAPSFGRYHVFIFKISPSCTEKMSLLRQWHKGRRRSSIKIFHRLFANMRHRPDAAVPTIKHDIVSYDLHFINAQLGFFEEFSAEEAVMFPLVTTFLLIFTLLLRFQLASTRLLWTNTGVSIASMLLLIFFFKWASLLFTWFGLIFFAFHGVEAHSATHDYKLGSLLLDGFFGLGMLVLLLATSKGWMITTPSIFVDTITRLQFFVLFVNAFASVSSLARFLFPLTDHHSSILSDLVVGSSHLYVFVTSYADLVNLMRRSRLHVGAKPRARAFNVIAALLLIWAITPVVQIASTHLLSIWLEPAFITFCTLGLQTFSSVLLAWAFRPELLWELHGERPHIGASKLLFSGQPSKSFRRFEDSTDELDGLLAV